MSTQLTPEQRAERLKKIIQILALGVVCVFISPFVFSAIQGLLGLLAFGAIAGTVWFFSGVVGSVLKNWRLKAYKAEAMRNPVETLQNILIEKVDALARALERINNLIAARGNFRSKIDEFKREHPEMKAEITQYEKQDAQMLQLIEVRKQSYRKAKKLVDEFKDEIDCVGAVWEMSQEAIAAQRAAGMAEGDILQEIQKKTAVDAVSRNMNLALADLETSLLEETPVNNLGTSRSAMVGTSTEESNVDVVSTPFVRAG